MNRMRYLYSTIRIEDIGWYNNGRNFLVNRYYIWAIYTPVDFGYKITYPNLKKLKMPKNEVHSHVHNKLHDERRLAE